MIGMKPFCEMDRDELLALVEGQHLFIGQLVIENVALKAEKAEREENSRRPWWRR